ncbi:MAG: hypothetical protein ABI587_12855 [Gemmatimonadales bacterium]
MPEIHPFFVFEGAQGIDLAQAERIVGGGSERQMFPHRDRATAFVRFRPAPLRVAQEGAPLLLGRWSTEAAVDLVLYDFGAASVAYQITVDGGLADLQEVSALLRRPDALRLHARVQVESLLQSLGTAVTKPSIAEFMEDYRIIGMRDGTGNESATAFCETHRGSIAQSLRPDTAGLSDDEVVDATEVQISFGPSDVTIVDWDAAFVLDPDPEDVRAVLESANVQLLEMRWLDLQLDAAIERSYHLLRRTIGWRAFMPGAPGDDLRQVAELQLESAVLVERVTNALKVFGEAYQTRIYRLASRRFQLAELDASITRKLSTIESIYQKLSDRAGTVRMETLEWVVIILIAMEIVISLGWH